MKTLHYPRRPGHSRECGLAQRLGRLDARHAAGGDLWGSGSDARRYIGKNW